VRQSFYLLQRYRAILASLGLIFVLLGAIMLTPLLALAFWPAEAADARAFLVPATVLILAGLALWRTLRGHAADLTLQEGGVIVLLGWTAAVLFSAWPLMTVQGLNFTQAVFESMSGWTTTGLSVVDVTKAGHVVLLWRSIMQLFGGAGIAIIMLAAVTGPTSPSVGAAEGRDQLVPNVRRSAKIVMMIYAGYAVVGTIALYFAGMTWFDAVNHCFPAISTGGFGTHPENIGYWNSPVIEAVCIVLMIAGNLNFVTAWVLLRGRFRDVSRNGEVRLQAVLFPLSAVVVFLFTARALYPALGKAARVAIFETVSALTTTGFSTVGYTDWNAFGVLVLIALMLVGGGTCSTAGGIKQYRVYMLWKGLVWELRRPFRPRTAIAQEFVQEAERQVFVTDARLRLIGVFVFLYIATWLVGSAVLMAHGFALKESLFEFASAEGTVGLSIGLTSAANPPAVLWTMTVGMFLGRLEFFVIFVSAAKLVRDLGTFARRS
jgi:trk system potassium uptake protein